MLNDTLSLMPFKSLDNTEEFYIYVEEVLTISGVVINKAQLIFYILILAGHLIIFLTKFSNLEKKIQSPFLLIMFQILTLSALSYLVVTEVLELSEMLAVPDTLMQIHSILDSE